MADKTGPGGRGCQEYAAPLRLAEGGAAICRFSNRASFIIQIRAIFRL
jgi:hypothetical protein